MVLCLLRKLYKVCFVVSKVSQFCGGVCFLCVVVVIFLWVCVLLFCSGVCGGFVVVLGCCCCGCVVVVLWWCCGGAGKCGKLICVV